MAIFFYSMIVLVASSKANILGGILDPIVTTLPPLEILQSVSVTTVDPIEEIPQELCANNNNRTQSQIRAGCITLCCSCMCPDSDRLVKAICVEHCMALIDRNDACQVISSISVENVTAARCKYPVDPNVPVTNVSVICERACNCCNSSSLASTCPETCRYKTERWLFDNLCDLAQRNALVDEAWSVVGEEDVCPTTTTTTTTTTTPASGSSEDGSSEGGSE